MFSRRKKRTQIFRYLKDHPDKMYFCPEFIAVYTPAIGQVIVVTGDYSGAPREELEVILLGAMQKYLASMN